MTARLRWLWVCLCCASALAAVWLFGADYLLEVGFPLDDSWIHMVYGRSLAVAGEFAYNPGDPEVGLTSLIWASVVALPHMIFENIPLRVIGVKVIGLLFHFGTVIALALYFGTLDPEQKLFQWAGAAGLLTVAIHPDLLAAAVSGMEVSLAAFVSVLIFTGTFRDWPWLLAVGSLLAPLSRPECAVFSVVLPVLFMANRREFNSQMVIASTVGNLVGWGILMGRCLWVWGAPLPSTFYAKAGNRVLSFSEYIERGKSLLDQIPVLDAGIIMVVAVGWSCWKMLKSSMRARPTELSLIAGFAFIVSSFALIPPIDPPTFYHQRFILPAVPIMVFSVYPVAVSLLKTISSDRAVKRALIFLVAVLLSSFFIDLPNRFDRLENDARNIDQLQVSMGQSLQHVPEGTTIWLTDAGAIRYFGNAYAVDLMGLNTSEVLTSKAQNYLDRHPANYIHYLPEWLRFPEDDLSDFNSKAFNTDTDYTVTSSASMGTHYLLTCHSNESGKLKTLTGRRFNYVCYPPSY